jgi:hypothetical protein
MIARDIRGEGARCAANLPCRLSSHWPWSWPRAGHRQSGRRAAHGQAIRCDRGQEDSIELGTPTAHGWYALISGSYKVGDQEFLANGVAKEGEFHLSAGCVYIAWESGGRCFFPSENQDNKAHEFLKSIHGGRPITLGLIPPAGAHGAFITGSTMRPKRGCLEFGHWVTALGASYP